MLGLAMPMPRWISCIGIRRQTRFAEILSATQTRASAGWEQRRAP